MSYFLPEPERLRLREALKSRGLRPTRQRSCVYAVILAKRDHPTADEVHGRVRKNLPSISLATVYNCLDALVECGLVRQVNLDRSSTRFCPNQEPHAHFRCKETGKVYDVALDEQALSRLDDLLPDGFKANVIDLSFSGVGPEDPSPVTFRPNRKSTR